jgi:hypothetical protein
VNEHGFAGSQPRDVMQGVIGRHEDDGNAGGLFKRQGRRLAHGEHVIGANAHVGS